MPIKKCQTMANRPIQKSLSFPKNVGICVNEIKAMKRMKRVKIHYKQCISNGFLFIRTKLIKDSICRSKLVETKQRQKLRNKPNGVNIIGLALGKKITIEEEMTSVMVECSI